MSQLAEGIGETVRAVCEDEGLPCLLLGEPAAAPALFTRLIPARECAAVTMAAMEEFRTAG